MVRLVRSVFDIRRGELTKTAGMFLFFFIVIACYWFLKPLRSALTLEKLGADAIRELKILTAFVSAGVVAAYSIALTRLSRERLTFLVLGSFVWLMVFFWFFFTHYGVITIVYYCFYVFLDLFITVNVAVFWTFLADILDPDSAKRLYGLIGAGGVIGGFLGSFTCNSLVDRVDPATMILLVAALYAMIFPLVLVVSRRVRRQTGVAEGVIAPPAKSKLSDALAGARVVLSSPYFLGICFVLACYEFISTVNDFTLHKAVELAFEEQGGTASLLGLGLSWIDSVMGLNVSGWLESAFGLQIGGGTLGSFFSGFFLTVNLAAILVQVLLTSLVIRKAGMTVALLVLPVTLVAVSTGFFFTPLFVLAEILFLCDNSLNYSMNQTSREMLFVPVPRQDKYRALAFIDMFVLRAAKATAGTLLFLPALLTLAFGWSSDGSSAALLRWYMLLTVPLGLVWIGVAVYLGRRFNALARDKGTPDPGSSFAEAAEGRLRTPDFGGDVT